MPSPRNSPEAPVERAPTPLLAGSLPQVWRETLGQIGQMLASDVIKAGMPAIFAPNTLVLRFPSGYNSAREYCQRPANVDRVQAALRKITGQTWNLRLETVADNSAAEPAKTAEDGEETQSRYRKQRTEALKQPLVQSLVEVLGANLIEVEEGFASAETHREEATQTEEA